MLTLPAQERRVLPAWDIQNVAQSHVYMGGTVNHNRLLETPQGAFVLRRSHGEKTPQHLNEEWRVMRHVSEKGVPAVLPLETAGGSFFVRDGEALFTLFPRAAGSQVSAVNLTHSELEAMGEMLARLTLALEDCPPGALSQRQFSATSAETLDRLDRLEKQILAYPEPGKDEAVALNVVRVRRAFLKAQPCPMVTDGLNFRVAHGDYHERNLFFARDNVVAIIDWDQVRVMPRYFELLRAAQFLLGQLGVADVRHFVRAFLQVYPVDDVELAATVALFSHERVHNLWLLESIYFESNTRARALLPRQKVSVFTPFKTMWAMLIAD